MDKKLKLSSFTPSDGLTLVFIHLKLSNQIDWSWWFVLLPFVMSVIFTIIFNAVEEALKNR